MQIHRFQSPFEHWVGGLIVELLVFGGFIVVVSASVAVIMWIL